nr:cupredoxin domain-containing protein [uncultured Methanoregula sp.]
MKKVLVLLIIVALLAIASGCSQPQAPAEQQPATPVPAKTTPRATSPTYLPVTTIPVPTNPPSVSDNTITISKSTFNPSQYTVTTGANVRWVNNDDKIHRLKFLDGIQSQIIGVGQSYTRSFDKPGIYDYTCTLHPSMQGTITVE